MAKMQCNFISYVLKRTVDITVIVPSATMPEAMTRSLGEEYISTQLEEIPDLATHKISAPYPVLYLLHGMGNNHTAWTAYTNIEMFAEEKNIAVVMISGENKCYINNDGDQFADFLQEELPEFICNYFPVSNKPEDTYIAGLSMGGFGALVHALSNPEKYAAFGAFSAGIILDPAMVSGGESTGIRPEYDPNTLLKELHGSGKQPPKAFIACGNQDFLYQDNVDFVKAFKDYGFDCTWTIEEGYGHEWRFWNKTVEAFLDWLPRQDEYCKKPMRRI